MRLRIYEGLEGFGSWVYGGLVHRSLACILGSSSRFGKTARGLHQRGLDPPGSNAIHVYMCDRVKIECDKNIQAVK